jgi:PPOX class probable F420-dependent enzyme
LPRTYLLEGDHLEFWRERHLCTVTTLRADGSPHSVPMGIVVDPDAGVAWGITSRHSQKVANLRRDPRMAVNQVDGRRWSTLEGDAEVLEDAESVAEAVRQYASRYRQPRENDERVAVRLSLAKVIGNV